ncbi:hypothetical protein evm_001795 [Chilo suppressalis]|nr:hypothetical protein evm_001795 [Chilo suppressalis]
MQPASNGGYVYSEFNRDPGTARSQGALQELHGAGEAHRARADRAPPRRAATGPLQQRYQQSYIMINIF